MQHFHPNHFRTPAQQYVDARRERELDAIETLIGALEDYRTRLRFKTSSDFEELQVCTAIIGLFDDGDVVGRRDAILDENHWDYDGNPLPGDLINGNLIHGGF